MTQPRIRIIDAEDLVPVWAARGIARFEEHLERQARFALFLADRTEGGGRDASRPSPRASTVAASGSAPRSAP